MASTFCVHVAKTIDVEGCWNHRTGGHNDSSIFIRGKYEQFVSSRFQMLLQNPGMRLSILFLMECVPGVARLAKIIDYDPDIERII
jgi:hypothetical protein